MVKPSFLLLKPTFGFSPHNFSCSGFKSSFAVLSLDIHAWASIVNYDAGLVLNSALYSIIQRYSCPAQKNSNESSFSYLRKHW